MKESVIRSKYKPKLMKLTVLKMLGFITMNSMLSMSEDHLF